jgi:hypothetical protein
MAFFARKSIEGLAIYRKVAKIGVNWGFRSLFSLEAAQMGRVWKRAGIDLDALIDAERAAQLSGYDLDEDAFYARLCEATKCGAVSAPEGERYDWYTDDEESEGPEAAPEPEDADSESWCWHGHPDREERIRRVQAYTKIHAKHRDIWDIDAEDLEILTAAKEEVLMRCKTSYGVMYVVEDFGVSEVSVRWVVKCHRKNLRAGDPDALALEKAIQDRMKAAGGPKGMRNAMKRRRRFDLSVTKGIRQVASA